MHERVQSTASPSTTLSSTGSTYTHSHFSPFNYHPSIFTSLHLLCYLFLIFFIPSSVHTCINLYPFKSYIYIYTRTLLLLYVMVMEGHGHQHHQAAAGSSSSTSSWSKKRDHGGNSKPFPHSLLHRRLHNNTNTKVEDSDEDMFTVPDVAAAGESGGGNNNEHQSGANSKRRSRGRNPADKEHRRLKRLLRNRVSAQQARERKKVYVNELEGRAKELQDNNSSLEEKISTLLNENNMLRKVLLNTRPKADETMELKNDHLSKK